MISASTLDSDPKGPTRMPIQPRRSVPARERAAGAARASNADSRARHAPTGGHPDQAGPQNPVGASPARERAAGAAEVGTAPNADSRARHAPTGERACPRTRRRRGYGVWGPRRICSLKATNGVPCSYSVTNGRMDPSRSPNGSMGLRTRSPRPESVFVFSDSRLETQVT